LLPNFKKNSTASNNLGEGEIIRPSSSGMTAGFGK